MAVGCRELVEELATAAPNTEVALYACRNGTLFDAVYLSPRAARVIPGPGTNSIMKTVHAEDRSRVRAALRRAAEGLPFLVTYRVPARSGWRWLEQFGAPVETTEGKMVVGVLRDVTRRAARTPEECAARAARLTPREAEVFELLARGMVLKEVAAVLGISIKTVQVHASRVYSKLDARSPIHLAEIAELLGL